MLFRGVDSVAHFMTLSINILNQTQTVCFSLFNYIFGMYSIFWHVGHLHSGRSYHQKLFLSTVAGVKCLCGGRKKSPRISSLVQLSILSGLSGSSYVVWCIRKLNIAWAGARGRWQLCTFHYCQWTVWIKPRLQFSLFYCIFCFREIISPEFIHIYCNRR